MAGQVIDQRAARPLPVTRRKGFRADLDRLRERMAGLGFDGDEAAEVARRYTVRPRQAYRLARGWSLDQAAARFNEVAAREGTDPRGMAGMTGPHLCEYEQWPRTDRRPSVYVLAVLARVYETDPVRLLDLADREGLDPRDLLALGRPAQPPRAAGKDGDKPAAPAAPRERGAGPGVHAADADGYGLSLSLPYVPGRLVIEISDPAAAAAPAQAEPGSGHLALVRDSAAGEGRAEAAAR